MNSRRTKAAKQRLSPEANRAPVRGFLGTQSPAEKKEVLVQEAEELLSHSWGCPSPAPLQPWYPGGHSSLCRSSQLPSPANTFRLEIPGWIPPTWNLLSPMSVSSRLPAGVRGSTPASLTRLLVAPQLNGDGVRGQGRGVPGQGEVALRARSAVVLPAGLIHQLALLGVRHFTWVHWRGAGGELREGLGPRGIQGRRSGAL